MTWLVSKTNFNHLGAIRVFAVPHWCKEMILQPWQMAVQGAEGLSTPRLTCSSGQSEQARRESWGGGGGGRGGVQVEAIYNLGQVGTQKDDSGVRGIN